MNGYTLFLNYNFRRPVVKIYGLDTLIDTGAIIPVFSMPKELLEKAFDAKLVLDNASFGGFGGECKGKIYSLSNFVIGSITYNPMEVFVPDEPTLKFPFLLSSSLFYGTNYHFDTINNMFVVNMPDNMSQIREFKIKDINGELCAQIDGILLQDSYEKPITNFTQTSIDSLLESIEYKNDYEERE